jgi:hypothetical protein
MEQAKSIAAYVVVYLLWAVSILLGYWVISDLRDAILASLAVASLNRYQSNARDAFNFNLKLRATDVSSWIGVGIVLVILIVYIEFLYRTGMPVGRLWSRFFLVTAIGFGILALTGLTNDLLRAVIGAFTWRGLFLPVVQSLVAVYFFWLWRSRRLKENLAPASQAS